MPVSQINVNMYKHNGKIIYIVVRGNCILFHTKEVTKHHRVKLYFRLMEKLNTHE